MRLSRQGLSALSVIIALVTCTTPVDPTPVATVQLFPAIDSVRVSNTRQLEARVFDAANNQLQGRRVNYHSNAPEIISVDTAGVVRGVSVGSALVSATVEGKVATSTWKVIAAIAQVAIAPLTADIPLGSSRQLAANVLDAQGNAISGRPIVWSSSNPAVATVSVSGLVSAVSLGTATITATSEGKSGSATITVVDPVASVRITPPGPQTLRIGGRLQLSATALNVAGQTLSGRTVNWLSSNPNVASVNQQTGEVTAVTVGNATITAEIEGRTAQSAVGVTLIPVATVTLTPTSLQLFRGEQRQLTLTSTDSTGAPITSFAGRNVLFQSNNLPIAQVNNAGVVFATDTGTANITVTVDAVVSAPVVVTVKLVPVATVTVNPNPDQLQCQQTRQYVAILRDANQNILVGRPVVWASSDTTKGSITAAGVLTAKAVGTLQVTATAEGVVGLSNVTIVVPTPPQPNTCQ
ncbi:MAG: Ig-like domain-containing protein [Gemmatimonadaceae bacterium]